VTHERWVSATLVAMLHAALLWALLTGVGTTVRRQSERALATFDVTPPPPPPPPAPPTVAKAAAPKAAGVSGRRAERTAIVAPPPVIPPPSAAAVVAAVLPDLGSAATGGEAERGSGSGKGVGGWGTGAGGQGRGRGGTRATLLSGSIGDRDYPRAARAARVEGIAVVRFTVGTDGRAHDCRVATSSGSADLDAVTCRLIEARFRYAPARDGAGQPVPEERGWRQRWWIE
jgi:protein TonB